MFPPPTGISFDSALGSYLDLPINPHVLLTPSDLTPFAKRVKLQGAALSGEHGISNPHGYLCINPGRLCKGRNPGTFAKAYISLDQMTNDNIDFESGCRVEILKL